MVIDERLLKLPMTIGSTNRLLSAQPLAYTLEVSLSVHRRVPMEDNLLSVFETHAGRIEEQGLITIRLPFLQGESQNSGQTYLLKPEVASLLVSQINRQLDLVAKLGK
jgi:hypothetical protein